MDSSKTLIVIAGPTAVGKTSVAIELAKKLATEIVSADSRQVYREMTIGTAKPSETELKEVKHYFVNTLSISEDYDAARFGEEAIEIINQIFQRNNYALLCGGSGLYIKAVCEGFDDIPEISEHLRESLIRDYQSNGIEWLQDQMKALDPEHLEAIDKQNPHRLIRALEVRIGTGKSISFFQQKKKREHDFIIKKIGLELPREELYKRIDSRMDKMIEEGLFDEAQSLYPFKEKNALQTVGYQEVFDYLDKKIDYDEAVRLLKRNSRRYAKRQLTWFKRDQEMKWFSPDQLTQIFEFVTQT